MYFRNSNAPTWLQFLLRELMKPPYFLERPEETNSAAPSTPQSADPASRSPERSNGFSSTSGSSLRIPSTRMQRTLVQRSSPRTQRGQRLVRTDGFTSTRDARRSGDIVATTMPAKAAAGTQDTQRSWHAVMQQLELAPALLSAYDWRIKDVQQHRNVAHIVTSDGNYALKRTHISPQRVQFLHNVLRYLSKRGFTNVAHFALTKKRRPYAVREGITYYATEWMDGQTANFASTAHIARVAHALARFHHQSRGFETDGYHPPTEFQFTAMMRRRTRDLRLLLEEAEKTSDPDAFDDLLVSMAANLRKDADKSLELASGSECQAHLTEEAQRPGLCHLDVIPGNFIYTGEHEVVLLDLDLCAYAPRVLDLAHLLRRSLQQNRWATDTAYLCFLQYNAVQPMTEPEYVLVRSLLTFPYRAWRLAQTRYRTFTESSQTEELQLCAEQEERRQAFLQAFSQQIKSLRSSR